MALDALPTSFAKCLRGLDLARELLDVLLLSVPNFLHCDFALRVFIGATPWEALPRLSAGIAAKYSFAVRGSAPQRRRAHGSH